MIEQWNNRVKQIQDLHNGIISSMRRSVEDAIKIGEVLNAQRQDMERGVFVKWILAELPFSIMTAYKYLGLWEYRDKIQLIESRII